MELFKFDLQLFAEVIVGEMKGDHIAVPEDKTQVYGLAGNDTLETSSKNNVLLIGGTGDDVLQMTGGNGTLAGCKGSDTFKLNYSADKKLSAVIEDIDPTNDKIIVTYDSGTLPQLSYKIRGDDVIWTDDKGYFNLTLKGTNEASDYYEGNANEYIWDILRITNQERENQKLPSLTLSQGLMEGATIRAPEIISKFDHERPNGSSCFTAVQKSYWGMGENIAAGNGTPDKTMNQWMNSSGHRANILNYDFNKIGVGYIYDTNSEWNHYWVQMFGGSLTSSDTMSTSEILNVEMEVTITAETALDITNTVGNTLITGSAYDDNVDNYGNNVTIRSLEGNDDIYTSADNVTILTDDGNDIIYNRGNDVIIDGGTGADSIKNNGSEGGGNRVSIIGGKGTDTIHNSGHGVTINGGADSDIISLRSIHNLIQYASGDGNDTIYGFKEVDTLTITGGAYTTQTSGDDVIVNVGSNFILLKGATGKHLNINEDSTDSKVITLTKEDDSLYTTLKGITINALDGNDYIGNYEVIKRKAGTYEYEIISSPDDVTINGGQGNDRINSEGSRNFINGGYGNDNLYSGDNSTINGDDGNDAIYSDGVVVK